MNRKTPKARKAAPIKASMARKGASAKPATKKSTKAPKADKTLIASGQVKGKKKTKKAKKKIGRPKATEATA